MKNLLTTTEAAMARDTMIDVDQLFRAPNNDWQDLVQCWHELDLPEPTEAEAKAMFKQLPHHIQATAIAWGTGDTVFRDNMLVHMRDNLGLGAKNV
jgi:hypothetical protein